MAGNFSETLTMHCAESILREKEYRQPENLSLKLGVHFICSWELDLPPYLGRPGIVRSYQTKRGPGLTRWLQFCLGVGSGKEVVKDT